MIRNSALIACLLAGPLVADPLGVPFDSDYEPLSYLSNGEPDGFDVAVARVIADEIGEDLTFAATDFNTIQSGEWQDDWDFAVASMSRDPTRETRFRFIGPYYYDTIVLVSAKGEPDDPAEEDNATALPIAGDRIGVCRGCIYKTAILTGQVALVPGSDLEGTDVTFVEFSTDIDALLHLGLPSPEGIDHVLTSSYVADQFIGAGYEVAISIDQLFIAPVWIVVPADASETEEKVRQAFDRLSADGAIEALWRDFFERDYINPAQILQAN
ncbi:transporter substrate-binding domain-containing protein [Aestuariibius insulae]|uniref:transporter substrate-binding domain-containing protein n=1 Tax=Aestuariibius insulae TaxID=2058287 RepID=UPI00345E92BE